MKLSKFQRALYLLVLLGWGICAPAQTPADVRLGELLNSGDLFRLRDEYPQLKDSLSIGMLDLLARSQLGVGFNRPEEAAPALDSLLLLHQEALGTESTLSMAALRAMNLLNLGMYAQAGAAAGDLVRVLEKSLPFESYFGLVFIERIGKALSDVPAPRLERPDRTVTVPMRYGEVGRGHHLYIPVEVNGQRRDFIFDTGCPFGCFVSEGYAEEVGLRIVADSIPVSGMAIGFVKLAVADSLRIGGMVYHHPFFLVAPPDPEVDAAFAFDGIIGYDLLHAVGEVVIDNETGEFRFPVQPSDGAPNMYLSGGIPRVRIEYEGLHFEMIFDTGNVKSDLDSGFAGRFPDAVAGLAQHTTRRGGFGGIEKVEAVTLPEFRFRAAGHDIVLHDTEVISSGPEGGVVPYNGSLGADFVRAFRRLTINYERMFIRGE
ncbi:MAG TPA: retropepsin-like domain-containing protein [Candidatus Alistipes cottocaccae]|nr:retropepsin-like domain-containing protein [Candidatus Alistipes cottocaccae]